MKEPLKSLDEIPIIIKRLKKIEDEIRDSAEKITAMSEMCEKRIDIGIENLHMTYNFLIESLETLIEYRSKVERLLRPVKFYKSQRFSKIEKK